MDVLTIRSHQNKRLKHLRAAREGRADDLLFLEGRKLAEEVLSLGLPAALVVVSEPFLKPPENLQLVQSLVPGQDVVLSVPPWLMAEISDVQTPPGIVVLVPRQAAARRILPEACSFLPIVHQVQDPGNLGTIIRSAEAASADGIVVTRTSVDPWGPKALRGSMGAALRLPVHRAASFPDALHEARRRGLHIVATSPKAQTRLWDIDWRLPCAIILGSEGSGLSDEERSQADMEVTIPMAGPGDSLNVSAAAAVLFFEVARQRLTGSS